jgi:tripartite-type tricarboxylate transporter receptor subunit TctC
MKVRSFLHIAVLLCFSLSGTAFAQSYPDKPIRLIVPYPPGGGTDVVARLIAQRLSETSQAAASAPTILGE